MIRFLVLFCLSLAVTAETKFFVLGSGTPNPNPDRSGSAYLVLQMILHTYLILVLVWFERCQHYPKVGVEHILSWRLKI